MDNVAVDEWKRLCFMLSIFLLVARWWRDRVRHASDTVFRNEPEALGITRHCQL